MENKELTIKITVQDAEVIVRALIKMPYEQVASLIPRFDTQVKEQLDDGAL